MSVSCPVGQQQKVRNRWPESIGRKVSRLKGAVRAYEQKSQQKKKFFSHAAVIMTDEKGRLVVFGNRMLCESVRCSSTLQNAYVKLNDCQHLRQVRS